MLGAESSQAGPALGRRLWHPTNSLSNKPRRRGGWGAGILYDHALCVGIGLGSCFLLLMLLSGRASSQYSIVYIYIYELVGLAGRGEVGAHVHGEGGRGGGREGGGRSLMLLLVLLVVVLLLELLLLLLLLLLLQVRLP